MFWFHGFLPLVGDDVNASVSLPFALENNSALIYVNGYSLGTIFPGKYTPLWLWFFFK